MQKIEFESLNVDKLIETYVPTSIKDFKKEKLIHVLDLIYSIPALNKNIEIIRGFVPISASLLQNRVRDYKKYIDYLLESKVLECDNRYIKGRKCKGYKLCKQYNGNLLSPKTALLRKSPRRSKNDNLLTNDDRRKYNYLIKWYNRNLQIDYEAANKYIALDLERKISDPNFLDIDETNGDVKDARIQYSSAKFGIDKIRDGFFRPSIDDNVFRFHSILTNLRSELRNFMTYEKQRLVSIDIKNCQPFLSTLILNSSFWSDEKTVSGLLNINDVFPRYRSVIFNNSLSLDSFIMLCKSKESHTDSDLKLYKYLVEKGLFYSYMEIELSNRLDQRYTEKKYLKAALFQVLFTDNRFLGQEGAAGKRVFKELFPTVYELFARIKKKDKANLPKLLQRIESFIIIKTVTKRIGRERRELPIFTVHDSIVTTVGNEEYVAGVIKEEIKRMIGLEPHTSIEYWRPENLHFIKQNVIERNEVIGDALPKSRTSVKR